METFNGLKVPPTNIYWERLQKQYCDFSTKCVIGSCKHCMFFEWNLNEFKTWFKSNLKDERKDT